LISPGPNGLMALAARSSDGSLCARGVDRYRPHLGLAKLWRGREANRRALGKRHDYQPGAVTGLAATRLDQTPTTTPTANRTQANQPSPGPRSARGRGNRSAGNSAPASRDFSRVDSAA